jgi:hypothetical protein
VLVVLLAHVEAFAAEGRSRVVVQGGQAFAPPSARFAEFTAVAMAREFPLEDRFGITAEAYPLFLVNQTRADHETRERVLATALGVLLTFDVGRRGGTWGLRLEGGAGVFYGISPVPVAGTRFNFLDQAGASLVFRLNGGRKLSAGYRWVHISNGSLVGRDNPGLSFHSLVLGTNF